MLCGVNETPAGRSEELTRLAAAVEAEAER